MISVSEARKIIAERHRPAGPSTLPLTEAAGLVLAEDVRAGCDVPGFPQSAMDGYAYAFDSWENGKSLQIAGMVAAGDQPQALTEPGCAVRIFTGAPLPPGTDTVVQQEHVSVVDGMLSIIQPDQERGRHVRPQGSEIQQDAVALQRGQVLTPAAIGFLMSVGVSAVPVFAPPEVGLIVTGKELQTPGQTLSYGQVYESNSGALTAALRQAGVRTIRVSRADDTLDSVLQQLREQLVRNDLVLLTGGISVGDFDFVLEAARRCGVEEGFYKVKQRPGKPLFFGSLEDKLVFALPGNPASALTCFYEYVLPVIGAAMRRDLGLPQLMAPLLTSYRKNNRLTQFLKGQYDGNAVRILDAQESYRLSSFALANCLVVLPEAAEVCPAGQSVEVHLLPIV